MPSKHFEMHAKNSNEFFEINKDIVVLAIEFLEMLAITSLKMY